MADMPDRVWLRVCGGGTRFPGHQGYVTVTGDSIATEGRTVYHRADLVDQMAAALREAITKVENDRTLWTPEWQVWLVGSRAALQAYEAAQ